MPLLGLILFLVLSKLIKNPIQQSKFKKVSYSDEIKDGRNLLRWLRTALSWVFAYITYAAIQTALDHQSGLGKFSLVGIMAMILGPVAFFTVKKYRNAES